MKQLREDEIAKLIILLAIIIGGWLRFTPVIFAGFPINDGGMFYSMIEDLYTNHFALPAVTSYNFISIPYAYPPLAFYIGAALKAISGLDTVQVLMYVPALFSTFTIFAFLLLACQFFPNSYPKTALATMAFVILPRSYSWFVMGGGLTRSLGEIFLLLMLASALRLYKYENKHDIWRTGLLGGLVILSHPEATIHAITAVFLFWCFLGHDRKSFVNSLWVVLIAAIVSSPWWAVVLWQYGPIPPLNAAQTGGFSFYRLATPLLFGFANERLASVITVLGILGALLQISQRDFLLSAWIFVHYITLPRSADAMALLPLALLSAVALYDMVFPVLTAFQSRDGKETFEKSLLTKSIVVISMIFLTLYSTISSFLYSVELAQNHLSQSNRIAMQWVEQNTPTESRFLVLSGPSDPMLQTANEWFPALAKRRSELTLQGREWILGKRFMDSIKNFDQIQTCLFKDSTCLNEKTTNQSIYYEYIYIQKPEVETMFVNNLNSLQSYELVYDNKEVSIFHKR